MKITLNGNIKEIPSTCTVQALLEDLGVKIGTVAIARNAEVVPRSAYDRATMEEGDHIEIVRAVGGG